MLSFRDNNFANPVGLLQFIQAQGPSARIRNDKSGQKLVLLGDWETPVQRLKGRRRCCGNWPGSPREGGVTSPSLEGWVGRV